MNADDRAAWNQAIDDFEATLLLARRAPRTVELRRRHLEVFAGDQKAGPATVLPRQITAHMITRPWAPRTQHAAYTSIQQFFRWASKSGVTADDPTAGLPPVKIPRDSPRPVISRAVVIGALEAAEPRTRQMMELALFVGLKVNEIAAFKPSDIKRNSGGEYVISTRWEGGRIRDVPIPMNLARDYLALNITGHMFPGRINGHVSPAYVARLVSQALPPTMTSEKIRTALAPTTTGGYNTPQSVHLLDYPELINPVALQEQLFNIERDLSTDPPAAILESVNLLASVFQGVLDDAGVAYGEEKLPKFFRLASEVLAIDVEVNKKASEGVRNTMGALVTTVQSIAEIRNSDSKAHSRGNKGTTVQERQRAWSSTALLLLPNSWPRPGARRSRFEVLAWAHGVGTSQRMAHNSV